MSFEDLKKFQGQMWGAGPFEEIEVHISDMHDALVGGLGPQPGDTWLDVACGTGAVASAAARAGADVTGVDLAPALIETARRRSKEAGLEVDYETGDCENLRFQDGSFDVVSSSVGIMFAPDQRTTAAELARVCAPGRPNRTDRLEARWRGRRFLHVHATVSADSSGGSRQPARLGPGGTRGPAARRRVRA